MSVSVDVSPGKQRTPSISQTVKRIRPALRLRRAGFAITIATAITFTIAMAITVAIGISIAVVVAICTGGISAIGRFVLSDCLLESSKICVPRATHK